MCLDYVLSTFCFVCNRHVMNSFMYMLLFVCCDLGNFRDVIIHYFLFFFNS